MWTNELARGRNWSTATDVSLVDFGDCARCDFRWEDGGYAYDLFDTRAEAVENLERMGFSELK
jgi:hypothetical protein